MIRHVEFTINFDLTCDGVKEDFEWDTILDIKKSVAEYIMDTPGELIDNLEINKVWYEKD